MTFTDGFRGGLRDALNVYILVVLVVSQPILTILSSNTLFFLVRRSDVLEVVSLLLVLCVCLPGAVALILLLVGRLHPGAGRLVAAVLVGLCAGLFLAPMLKGIGVISGWQVVNLNVFLSALIAALYAFWPVLRTYITYMLPAVLVVPLLFWFNPGLQQTLDVSDPGATAHEVTSPHNVVMVVFDSFPITSLLTPERQIDAARFPNFARLAQAATWYRNASTVNELTWWSVPSLLTGRELYGEVPLPMYSVYPRNLFTAFGNSYDLHVTEYISNLCPQDVCRTAPMTRAARISRFQGLLQDIAILYRHSIYPEALADSLPRIGETLGGFVHGNVSLDTTPKKDRESPGAITDRFIESLDPASKPQLFFLHVLLPHAPWRYTPGGKEYVSEYHAEIHGLHGFEKQWRDDEWAVNLAYQRHLMQVAYTDFHVGRLVERLRKQGLYDDSLVIVVSDHGNSYRAGQYHRRATAETVADFLGVPLFIKYPGQTKGRTDDRNASIIDVLPTVFDQLGIRSDWPLEGMSLLSTEPWSRQGKRLRTITQDVYEVEEDYYLASTTIADKYALLATGEPVDNLFGISLIPELNGRALASFSLADSGDKFAIHRPEQFDAFDPGAGFAPVYLSGVARNVPVNTPLAVALNGRIVTVTKVFSDAPARRRFAAMLPEALLREGSNAVSVHRVEGGEGNWTLYRSQLNGLKR